MKKEIIDKINNIYWKYNTKPQTIKSPKDLAVLTSICAFGKKKDKGPIGISKCLFNGKEKITLITLGGTQFRSGQATRLLESKLSIKGKDNDYLNALINIFNSKNEKGEDIIPKDNEIIISGISLGGMIAQQLLSIPSITNNYKIKSIICFGSPLTKPLDRRKIRVIRFSEKGDIVPKIGGFDFLFSPKKKKIRKTLDKNELILEDGNYKTRLESHALSYIEHFNWDKYDFYGVLNGNNKLEILEEIKFYEAPIINK